MYNITSNPHKEIRRQTYRGSQVAKRFGSQQTKFLMITASITEHIILILYLLF